MVDVPERIWAASVTENYGEWQTTTDGLPRPTEYVRADLVAELEAENERLAGARVVTDGMVEAALKSLHSNPVSWEHPETVRAALTAALAEPAGEVEPVAWLRDIDGTGSLHPASKGDPGAFPVYPTPPDASAIRGVLVEIANGCSGRVDRDHLACRIASAALAGAKP